MPAHMHHGRGYVERNPDGFLTDDQLDEVRESIRDDDLSGVVMRAVCAAPAILRNAAQAIDDRAALRDCPAGEGLMINAHEYRRRAHQWRQDINTIAAAADDITRLQRQLNSARQSLAA